MDPQPFDEFTAALETKGVDAAFAQLTRTLAEQKDYHRLFEARMMQARHELGIPLVQLESSADLAPAVRDKYEERVIEACRDVGKLFLASGNLPAAHQYFHMIGEMEPIREAIEKFEPGDDEQSSAVIDIALSQGAHPVKGLSMVLHRYGLCQAISACEGLLGQGLRPSVREQLIQLLVRSLHSELTERLAAEVAAKEGTAPPATSVPILIQGRDWLFADQNYHVDTSHLNAVVRMARLLPKCPEIYLAMQLCEYGQKLADVYHYGENAPFEKVYADSLIYFKTVAGMDVEKGLEHFKTKADKSNPNEIGTYPAEVYVNLLTMSGKSDEAIAYAGRKLNEAVNAGATRMSINELCQTTGRFDKMAQLARRRNDLLSFAAGLIQQKTASA